MGVDPDIVERITRAIHFEEPDRVPIWESLQNAAIYDHFAPGVPFPECAAVACQELGIDATYGCMEPVTETRRYGSAIHASGTVWQTEPRFRSLHELRAYDPGRPDMHEIEERTLADHERMQGIYGPHVLYLPQNGGFGFLPGYDAQTCVKYFEAINTDKALYNILCYGVEDKHWVWVDKDKEVIGLPEGVTAENNPYNPNSDWAFGNQFNAYYTDPTKIGAWEACRKINNEATPSPIIGFVFDKEPVKTELAQISAVTAEYSLMNNGFINVNEVLSEYIERVKGAGADKVLEEINKQLDEWRASA